MEKKGLFKGKIIFVLVALIFALIGTSFFVGNRQIKIVNEITVAEDLTGPTESTEGYWTDEGRRGDSFAGGDGLTEETAYEIATAEQLAYLAYRVNNGASFKDRYFKQTADIDLSKYYWQPIGGDFPLSDGVSRVFYFEGNFNGANFTISGVFTKDANTLLEEYVYSGSYLDSAEGKQSSNYEKYCNAGIFGVVISGNFKNINVTNSYIQGYTNVGGIIGKGSNADLNNCHFSGKIKGSSYVGGILGQGSANIFNSSNTSDIEGFSYTIKTTYYDKNESEEVQITSDSKYFSSEYIGGIAGESEYIKNSSNFGSITGNNNIGGILGIKTIGVSEINNCFNVGNITGNNYLGGICSVLNNGKIFNCYNTGNITGRNDFSGGIVGYINYSNYTDDYFNIVTNSFNVGTIFSNTESHGSIVGAIADGENQILLNCYFLMDVGITGVGNCGEGFVDNTVSSETLLEDAKNIEWYQDATKWNEKNKWNFDYIWQINSEKNSGYPIFQGESNVKYWTDEDVIGEDLLLNGFSKGSGTKEDPYLIENEQDLAYLAYTVNNSTEEFNYTGVYFKQTKNLNLSEFYWKPIGYGEKSDSPSLYNYGSDKRINFSGIYDGDFYNISGIHTIVDLIDYDETSYVFDKYRYQGLFGSVCSEVELVNDYFTEIKNLGIIDSEIVGYECVGSIVGAFMNGVLTNCYNYSKVEGYSLVGGLIGLAGTPGQYSSYQCIIKNSFNFGDVSSKIGLGDKYCNYYTSSYGFGGIVGEGGYGISNCYNAGKIEDILMVADNRFVGGISGSSSVMNSFNVGEIIGSNVGGIIGVNTTYKNCYNVGKINGMVSAGDISSSSTEQTSEEITEETFKDKEFFIDFNNWYFAQDYNTLLGYFWDFDFTWEFREGVNEGFPVLNEIPLTYWTDYRVETFKKGEGTEDNPYEISTAEELALLAYEVNYGDITQATQGSMGYQFFKGIYFKQTADIDLSGRIWVPIGNMNLSSGEMRSFVGNFNGQNFKITGLKTHYLDYLGGLFGLCINDEQTKMKIENIVLCNSSIRSIAGSGGIVGQAMNFEIINCISYANVFSQMYSGGIVGAGINCEIKNCLNFGNIESSTQGAGGIAGMVQGKITESGNEGKIKGLTVGGICSTVMEGQITNCYSISNDETALATGGTISNCLYINANGKYCIGATDEEGNDSTSFKAFVWLNENSCPIPKSLTWLGQFFDEEYDITKTILEDSSWTKK